MPIQVLPQQLANQIAAGEVVERPASVVKELVENSLDAGATRIDIDIERGGSKLIRIRDNGSGIMKDELTLALERHATSKIASLDDLEAIVSLGFRGEALASISSVSRLTLTSRTESQHEAWQAYAEGRDMNVTLKPAAHPVGTTVEVLDLFFNTPARRKFLRTEKTEFNHIDEIVRRIALARFDVTIHLTHNGKLVRQYRAVKGDEHQERRLASICGPAFLKQALAVTWQHGDLSIKGWVVTPDSVKSFLDMQYCYVNGRMMRDRLINHAIRQAYQNHLRDDQQPAYVLYLELDPHQVDVNVHPAKHEVRFHQSRLVHDFIYQAVATALQQAGNPQFSLEENQDVQTVWQPENRQAAGENHFNQEKTAQAKNADEYTTQSGEKRAVPSYAPVNYSGRSGNPQQYRQQSDLYQKLMQPTSDVTLNRVTDEVINPEVKNDVLPVPAGPVILASHPVAESSGYGFGRVLMVIAPHFAVIDFQQKLAVLSLAVAERWLRQAQLDSGEKELKAQPLLIPVQFLAGEKESLGYRKHHELLEQMGIQLTQDGKRITIRAVPLPLRHQNIQRLLPELLVYLSEYDAMTCPQLSVWLARHLSSDKEKWNQAQAIQLLTELEILCPQLVKSPPAGLLQPIDLNAAIAALTDE